MDPKTNPAEATNDSRRKIVMLFHFVINDCRPDGWGTGRPLGPVQFVMRWHGPAKDYQRNVRGRTIEKRVGSAARKESKENKLMGNWTASRTRPIYHKLAWILIERLTKQLRYGNDR